LAQFWLARWHDRLIGGLCTFIHKDTVFLGYIGTEQSFQSDGVGQSLLWKAICDASQRGVRIVDFGKASSQAHGQIHYKKNWGAAELDTPVFYYPRVTGVSSYDDEQNLSYRLVRLFWRTMPAGLSRRAGRFFYRHVG
jgi:lipid II:glycine glycyltransferase (peptidoglycan interpeptide bridge formation enzyme)